MVGFEPTNNWFAVSRVKPLHHIVIVIILNAERRSWTFNLTSLISCTSRRDKPCLHKYVCLFRHPDIYDCSGGIWTHGHGVKDRCLNPLGYATVFNCVWWESNPLSLGYEPSDLPFVLTAEESLRTCTSIRETFKTSRQRHYNGSPSNRLLAYRSTFSVHLGCRQLESTKNTLCK